MNKFSSFLTFAGLAFVGVKSCIYTVDPGEKVTTIINNSGIDHGQFFRAQTENLSLRL
jgi:hypothetical protein